MTTRQPRPKLVSQAPAPEPTTALPDQLMTIKEAAAFAIVSVPTMRRWLGELPYLRAGRQIRIAKEDLVNFLRKGGSGHRCENP